MRQILLIPYFTDEKVSTVDWSDEARECAEATQHQYSNLDHGFGASWSYSPLGQLLFSVPIHPPLWLHRAMKFPRRKASGGKQEGYLSLKTSTIWYIINSYSHQRWDNPFGNKLPFWNSFSGCFHFHVFELKKKEKSKRVKFLTLTPVGAKGEVPTMCQFGMQIMLQAEDNQGPKDSGRHFDLPITA